MGTITDKLNKLEETKSAIKTAIVNKGVSISDTDTFASYADKINSISSGSGGGYEFDFTVLGYNEEECKDANDIANAVIALNDFTVDLITEAIAYGKELYDSSYSISDGDVDKNKLLFYPKLKLPYTYIESKVLYIPNVEYKKGGNVSSYAYKNKFLHKVGSITAEFDLSHYSSGFFTECTLLREVGDINITGKAINYNLFFNNCYLLHKISNLNTTGSTTFLNMFYGCFSLAAIPQLDTSSGTDFRNMFYNCYSLTTIPQLDTSSGTNLNYIFRDCSKLIKFGISIESLNTTISYSYFTGYSTMNNLRYALLKGLGTGSSMTSANFTLWGNWGKEDETIPESVGARQSLIDTLITYSFDRATAGYSACAISLTSTTKALLTEDEIAQITAKGYTIA